MIPNMVELPETSGRDLFNTQHAPAFRSAGTITSPMNHGVPGGPAVHLAASLHLHGNWGGCTQR